MVLYWVWWLGAALVALLGIYGAYLWWQVWLQKQQQLAVQQHRREQLMAQLAIMARAVEVEQVNVTEGALRLSAMLHTIDETIAVDVAVIHELAEQAALFAIGEARKRLSRIEREQQDKQREALEQRYGQAVVSAAKRLYTALPAGVSNTLVSSHAR